MPIITEVRFAHSDGALADTLEALPDLTARLVHETSTTPARDVSVVRFDGVDISTLQSTLAADHTVSGVDRIGAADEGALLGIEFASEAKLLAPLVTENDGFVLEAWSSGSHRSPRGWRERWFFPEREGIQNVWQRARSEGFDFEVLELTDRLRPDGTDVDPLTDQQRTALLTAYERGYFREPREASLADLASELDISPSAVNGRIRRGLKALIETGLITDDLDAGGETP